MADCLVEIQDQQWLWLRLRSNTYIFGLFKAEQRDDVKWLFIKPEVILRQTCDQKEASIATSYKKSSFSYSFLIGFSLATYFEYVKILSADNDNHLQSDMKKPLLLGC